jgi:AmiR/NasT family two-component response regulator
LAVSVAVPYSFHEHEADFVVTVLWEDPVVAGTGDHDPETARRAAETRGGDVITEPFDPSELREIVDWLSLPDAAPSL